jgi:hypothetical protein
MVPNFWLDFKSTRAVLAFSLLTLAFVSFWFCLPAEVRHLYSGYIQGRMSGLPQYMFIGWIGGWFTVLFVRAEDQNIVTPFAYQSLCKIIGVLMILAASAMAGFYLYTFYFVRHA